MRSKTYKQAVLHAGESYFHNYMNSMFARPDGNDVALIAFIYNKEFDEVHDAVVDIGHTKVRKLQGITGRVKTNEG